jgi:hypothetical protein
VALTGPIQQLDAAAIGRAMCAMVTELNSFCRSIADNETPRAILKRIPAMPPFE